MNKLTNKKSLIVAFIVLIALICLAFVLFNIYHNSKVAKFGNKIIAYPIFYKTVENGEIINHAGFIDSTGAYLKVPNAGSITGVLIGKKGIVNNGISTIFDYKDKREDYYQCQIWKSKKLHKSQISIINSEFKYFHDMRRYPYYSNKNIINIQDVPSEEFPTTYESLFKPKNGYQLTCDNKVCGITDKTGKMIIDKRYDKAQFGLKFTTPYLSNHFYGDNAFLVGGYFFDLKGKQLFKQQFDIENSLPFIQGLAWVYETKITSTNPKKAEVIRIGYINKKGEWIWSVKSTPNKPILWENKCD